jgi:exopolysaccharide biosynthesis polyprenyl glycosylphosphotransferase
MVVSYWLRTYLPILSRPEDPPSFLERYIPITAVSTLSILMVFYFGQMYHQRRAINSIDRVWRITQNVSLGVVIAIAMETMLFQNSNLQFDYPRGVIVYSWVLSILFVWTGREAYRYILYRLQEAGIGRHRVLVVGSNEVAKSIIRNIGANSALGYELIGAITESGEGRVAKLPVLGNEEDLPRLIDQHSIDQVIIALPEAGRDQLAHLVGLCQRGQVEIRIFPDNFAFIAGTITVDDLVGIPLLSVRDVALRGWKLSLKRSLDVFGSGLGLILLSPAFLLIMAIIWWYDRGPVFFIQERVGLDGRAFPMIKFRTMVVDAEKRSTWTVKNDERVTPLGKILRPTNMDELPQLINVFYGQMSLVGPRPEQRNFVEAFRQKYPRYGERHREKSGMTGWAQVNGLRGDTSIEDRLQADLYYVENWSLWLDIKIIVRTIWQTLTGRSPNAY